jgi:hypothetical protein
VRRKKGQEKERMERGNNDEVRGGRVDMAGRDRSEYIG